MNTDGEEINKSATVVSKTFICYELSQTPMDTHETNVQSAVMSGLEDVNSSQFFTRSIMNNLHGHSLKLWNYIRKISAK